MTFKITMGQVGLVDVQPSIFYLWTDQTLAEVLAPGYLDSARSLGYSFSENQAALTRTSDYSSILLQLSIDASTQQITLSSQAGGGGVDSVVGSAGRITSSGGPNPVIDLANVAGVVGAYTNADITIDAYGRITAAANGAAGNIDSVDGTANQIDVTAGSNPVVSLSDTVVMPGTLTLNANPVNPLEAATKQYVDAISSGFTFKEACDAGTTTFLGATYNNGAAGVGATFTNSGVQTAFTTDGIVAGVGSRILVKDEILQGQNGIYVVTNAGSGATNWVLTRSDDYNEPSEISAGDFLIVNEGTVNANSGWVQNNFVASVGFDAIVFNKLAGLGSVTEVIGTSGKINVTNGTTTPTVTISPSYSGQPTISSVGIVTVGSWEANTINPEFGGTGVDNGTNLITLGGDIATGGSFITGGDVTIDNDLTMAGNFAKTLTFTGATNIVFPTSGTLSTTTGTVTGVLPTANRISVDNTIPATPKVDIASTYAGQPTISTVGTLSAGSLATGFTPVTTPLGGTGVSSFTAYSVICGGTIGAGALQSVASVGTAGQVLTSSGPAAMPTWTTPTTGSLTGILPTTGRISIDNTIPATPKVDIDATYIGQPTITTVGTIGTGTWQGTPVGSAYGGTGVDNNGRTITIAGNLQTIGAFASIFRMSAATDVTFPTTGTLLTSAGLTNYAVLNSTNDFAFNIQHRAQLRDYSETVSALGSVSGATALNLLNGNVFTATVTGTTTFSVSNVPASGTCASLSLVLTNGGSASLTWPSGTKWPGGAAPTFTTSGIDTIVAFTIDGGTTWYFNLAGAAYA